MALQDLVVEEFLLKSKDRFRELRENTLGNEVIWMGQKYPEFPNGCLVRDLVKDGRNIVFDGMRTFIPSLVLKAAAGPCTHLARSRGSLNPGAGGGGRLLDRTREKGNYHPKCEYPCTP